jgi:hypothetical protein
LKFSAKIISKIPKRPMIMFYTLLLFINRHFFRSGMSR